MQVIICIPLPSCIDLVNDNLMMPLEEANQLNSPRETNAMAIFTEHF
jgi:hypothetical protein